MIEAATSSSSRARARADRPLKAGAHMDALDGVRGLAIVLVLFVHFVGDDKPQDLLQHFVTRLSSYGAWGVDLFFVLSGFLITGILYDSKNKTRYFRTFYVRRTLRIFPLYYGVLALLFVILPALRSSHSPGLAQSEQHEAWLWTYATNLYLSLHGSWRALPYVGHFWSLAVEEHFYLVWPMIVLSFSRKTLLRICVGGAAFALVLRCALSFAGVSDVALVAFTPCRLDALLTGAFLAVAARSIELGEIAERARPLMWWFAAGAAVTTAWNAKIGWLPFIVLPLRGTLVALTFGALLVVSLVAPKESLCGRFFLSSTMRFFGKYSYGLYVFQGIVAMYFLRHGVEASLTESTGSHAMAMALQAFAGAGLSCALAIASYELYEKHFLRLKRRFAPADKEVAEPVLQPSPNLSDA
ncbi:MAG: acyltransferase family protein [Polyangiaceae bacterium]